jgi:hypothetical protein
MAMKWAMTTERVLAGSALEADYREERRVARWASTTMAGSCLARGTGVLVDDM